MTRSSQWHTSRPSGVVLVCLLLLLLHPFPMVSWNCYVALEQSLEALGIARCTDCLPCSMSFKVVTHDCLACSNALQGCHHDCLLVQQCPPRLSSMTVFLFDNVLQGCCPWLSPCFISLKIVVMTVSLFNIVLQGCGHDVFVFSFTLHFESIWALPPFVSHFWLSFWTVADLFLSQGFRKGVSNFTAYSQNPVRKAVDEVVCEFWKWETYGWLTTHVLSFWFTSGRHISPEVDRLSGQYNDVRFLKVDLDEVPIFLADFLISKNIAMGYFSILS